MDFSKFPIIYIQPNYSNYSNYSQYLFSVWLCYLLALPQFLQLFLLFISAPAPQLAANLSKGPCLDKHCWYWIIAADTYLTLNHRLLSIIVDAPEQLWHAITVDNVETGKDDKDRWLRLTTSGHAEGSRTRRKPVSAGASSGSHGRRRAAAETGPGPRRPAGNTRQLRQ